MSDNFNKKKSEQLNIEMDIFNLENQTGWLRYSRAIRRAQKDEL